jgi:hypothetical protein
MKSIKKLGLSYVCFMLAFINFELKAQEQITLYLTNPVVISNTQLNWDVYIQNTSSINLNISLLTAHLQQKLVQGIIEPANDKPLLINLEYNFREMEFFPKVVVKNGTSIFKLNGGTPPDNPPYINTNPVKLGTIVLNSANFMNFQEISIGQTLSIPNVELSAVVNGFPTTFSVEKGNLILKNTWTENPIYFDLSSSSTQIMQEDQKEIVVFPNPSYGWLTYNWTGADFNKDILVKVFDQNGKLLLNRNLFEQTEGSLDISTYTPGMYFLHFENGDKTEKHKVIKID